jgi:hypothetical protein
MKNLNKNILKKDIKIIKLKKVKNLNQKMRMKKKKKKTN